jgi:hypothetical protein
MNLLFVGSSKAGLRGMSNVSLSCVSIQVKTKGLSLARMSLSRMAMIVYEKA